jgi:hypothetical protein
VNISQYLDAMGAMICHRWAYLKEWSTQHQIGHSSNRWPHRNGNTLLSELGQIMCFKIPVIDPVIYIGAIIH